MIKKLAKYVKWANEQVRKILYEVEDTRFEQNLGEDFEKLFVNDTHCPHPSIRSLVEHIMIGLEFCTYISQERSFSGNTVIQQYRELTKNELLDRWATNDEKFLVAFQNGLDRTVKINDRTLNLDEDFYFAFLNHVTYHRGQLNTALRMVGSDGTDADYSNFLKDT